jgi:hypothetical protein
MFGYLKNEVLIQEITNCCRNINEQMLQNIFGNKKVKVRKSSGQNGGHFFN